MERRWSEIRGEYYNEDEKCICIDAWKTTNSNEEGKVIAKVYADRVEYLNENARKDFYAQEKIEEAKKEIMEIEE